jgi:hypothetical protein
MTSLAYLRTSFTADALREIGPVLMLIKEISQDGNELGFIHLRTSNREQNYLSILGLAVPPHSAVDLIYLKCLKWPGM